MADELRINWNEVRDTTFATLVGTVDAGSADAVIELGERALDVERLVVDLEFVECIDEVGVDLLHGLSHVRNVAIINLSDAVTDALTALGRVAL